MVVLRCNLNYLPVQHVSNGGERGVVREEKGERGGERGVGEGRGERVERERRALMYLL